MVDRMLFEPWFGVEVRNVESVTSKAGWSPLPAGYASLSTHFPEGEVVAVDKASWDWTMPGWVVEAYLQVKKHQCRDWDERYERMVRSRLWEIVGPGATFRLEDGDRFAQVGWGLMKSGWYLTLSMNSMSQLFQHALAWSRLGKVGEPLPLCWAMGDDTIIRMSQEQDFVSDYERELATTGCLVKKSVLQREFCGVRVWGSGQGAIVDPLYPQKHQFTLAYINPKHEQDTLQSYKLLYALSGNRWIDLHNDKLAVDYGPLYKLWARGLVKLSILDDLPPWTAF